MIQESSEPFPVSRSGMVGDLKRPHSTNDQDDDALRKSSELLIFKCSICNVNVASLYLQLHVYSTPNAGADFFPGKAV